MSAAHDPSRTSGDAWRAELDDYLRERQQMPFAWGSNDCCLFAADAVVAMGGPDHAHGIRGTYASALEAQRRLEALGGVHALAGWAGEPIPPLAAGPGDVGVIEIEGRELLAVCAGATWHAPGAGGLVALPFGAARAAWRVPHA